MNEDGYASIYLNARLSQEKQRQCLKHELRHLDGDDHYNARDIQSIEHDADAPEAHHRELPPLMRAGDLVVNVYDDWKDDVFLALPYYE